MKPVNAKSLFATLCITLEQLDNAEIDVATANAKAKVVGQATNLLNYELKRSALMTNHEFREHHRNLELKNFDSLPE